MLQSICGQKIGIGGVIAITCLAKSGQENWYHAGTTLVSKFSRITFEAFRLFWTCQNCAASIILRRYKAS